MKFSIIFALLLVTSQVLAHDGVKPNVIFILADDLGYGDLSCYGQTKFQTPNIDKLAQKGLKFTQHYSGSTVCAPSRSTIITGQHTGHTPIRGNKKGNIKIGDWPLPEGANSIAVIFKNAGYTTGVFGKWGLGFPNSTGNPIALGFDVFYGYNCQRNAHHYYPWFLHSNNDKVVLEENAGTKTGVYAPNLIHDKALNFIEANKDQPFFLYYPSVIPHAEMMAPEEYMKKFRGKFLPEKSYKGVGPDKKWGYRKGAYGPQPEAHAAFAAMITLLDDQVGEIVQKLEELNISENTIIVFTSDNGAHVEGGADPEYFNSTAGFRGHKRDLYEGGIRAPMIIQWAKEIKPGSETDHISAFWDFLPTFAEVIGEETPENIDGISMLPTLTGKGKQMEHKYLYWEFYEQGGRQAVRLGDWKGVKYDLINLESELEIYNLQSDPFETTNVADKYPGIVKKMEGIIKKAHVESDVFQFETGS